MASKRDSKLPEVPSDTSKRTTKSLGSSWSLTPRSVRKSRYDYSASTESSPAVLEPSKHKSRSVDNGSLNNLFPKAAAHSMPPPSLEPAQKFPSDDLSDFTQSSPPVLEPSKDGSRSKSDARKKQNLFQEDATRSLPKPYDEPAPICPTGPNVVRAAPIFPRGRPAWGVASQGGGLIEEPRTSCGTTVYNCYRDCAIYFRNSALIHIFQVLLSSIPFSAIVMGTIFIEDCAKYKSLPALGAVFGVFGVVFIVLWIVVSYFSHRATPCPHTAAFSIIGTVLALMTVVDAVLVFCLLPSFDPASKDYCNQTFYTYAFYKEIAIVAALVLTTLLYIPGNRHAVCCENCSHRTTSSSGYSQI